MNDRSFLDSNILLYADDASAGPKQSRATELIESGFRTKRATLSTQVLQEYFVNATRKLKVPPDIARGSIEVYLQLSTVVVQPAHVLAAIDLHRLHSISFGDSLIVHSAQHANCKILYSEDLHH